MSVSYGEQNDVLLRREQFWSDHQIDPRNVVFIEPCHTGSIAMVSRTAGGFALQKTLRKPTIDCTFAGYNTGIDGLLTFDADTYIAVLTGDCVPLAFVDDATGLHGILHVGLLGLLNGITLTLSEVLETHSIPIDRLRFHLGPAISRDNYDLTCSGLWPCIETQVSERCGWMEAYTMKCNGSLMMDLPSALVSQLRCVGARGDAISRSAGCTAAPTSDFFSNYLAKQVGVPNGRFITVIGN